MSSIELDSQLAGETYSIYTEAVQESTLLAATSDVRDTSHAQGGPQKVLSAYLTKAGCGH